jgi:hypothetical protein
MYRKNLHRPQNLIHLENGHESTLYSIRRFMYSRATGHKVHIYCLSKIISLIKNELNNYLKGSHIFCTIENK